MNPPDRTGHSLDEAGHGAPDRRTHLLRAAADGELPAEDARELADLLQREPQEAGVIEFERRLRAEVELAASEHEAPASAALRDRVARLTHDAPRTSGRVIGRRAWLAAAAYVAIALGLVVVRGLGPPPRPSHGERLSEPHRASLVSFLSSQHEDCERLGGLLSGGFEIARVEDAPSALSELLGAPPELGGLPAEDVRFLSAAPCAVPGRGASIHMVFETASAGLVSLFVQQDAEEILIEEGVAHWLRPQDASDALIDGARTLVWRQRGLVYYLVSASAEDLDAVRVALGVTPSVGAL